MKVLIVEDHALFREGVSMILERLSEDLTIESAESADIALDLFQKDKQFDLILLDYNLPGMSGIDLLAQLISHNCSAKTILLSAEEDPNLIQNALAIGANGFITKSSSSAIMLKAIQLVMSGGIYIPPAVLTKQPAQTSHIPPNTSSPANLGIHLASNCSPKELLTERQFDVLEEMIKGLSNKEIARNLEMSPSTVKVHVAAILKEFGVKNRTQAVNYAKQHDLL